MEYIIQKNLHELLTQNERNTPVTNTRIIGLFRQRVMSITQVFVTVLRYGVCYKYLCNWPVHGQNAMFHIW